MSEMQKAIDAYDEMTEGRLMPMDRSKYPDGWEMIALTVKRAADWKCQECGQVCRRPGEVPVDFCARLKREAFEEGLIGHIIGEVIEDVLAHPQRYTLTVAHTPDPDPMNCSSDNLRALCAPCHLKLDGPHHAETRRANRTGRHGQLELAVAP